MTISKDPSTSGPLKKRDFSIPSFPTVLNKTQLIALQLTFIGPSRSLCKKCSRKAAILLWRCTNPWPPSS